MSNNLEEMIIRSGLARKDIAAIVDVKPETLSRHIHGQIKLTVEMAEEYAKALDCAAYDVLFSAKPLPIIGHCHQHADGKISRKISANKKVGKIYIDNYQEKNSAGIIWSVDKDYRGVNISWQNAIEIVHLSPVLKNVVSEHSIQNDSYVRFVNPEPEIGDETDDINMYCGHVYPNYDNTHTVFNPASQRVLKDRELRWATPVLSVVFRPDLRGIKIVYNK